MRLLHVHSGNLYGGVETMLATFARHNREAALEHEFALCHDGRLAGELRAAAVPIHWLGATRTSWPPGIARARRRLDELLGAGHFDAVACHLPWAQALLGKAVRARPAPLIFWMHDAARGRHWLERWARRTRPALAVCNSFYTATTLPVLYPETPYEVLYPPVEPRVRQPEAMSRLEQGRALRRTLATPPEAIVIVQASRLQPWKGHRTHLAALGRLRAVPGWICWIVGGADRRADQHYLARLKAQAAALGIADRVRFCGARTDVGDLLDAADLYCQPNERPEPFGIAFVEALGAGLPVITADCGGAVEIVDAACGLRVPPGDPERLAQALGRLIEDAPLRATFGRAAPARAVKLCDPRTRIADLASLVGRLTRRDVAGGDRAPRPATVPA